VGILPDREASRTPEYLPRRRSALTLCLVEG